MASPFLRIFSKLYDKEIKDENPFIGKFQFPLGTKKPYTHYRGDDIPERDMVYFRIPTKQNEYNDATSMVFIGKAGTQKGRGIKRMAQYYYEAGFQVGIFDLKGGLDWPMIKKEKKMTRLHPKETPRAYDIVAGSPNFAIRKLVAEEERRAVVQLNLPMKDFADRQILATLGFSAGAREIILQMIKKGLSPKKIESIVVNSEKMNFQSRENIMTRLSNIIDEEFFSDKKLFDLDAIWDQRKMWALGFFNQDRQYICSYVSIILRKIMERASRMKAAGKKERYLIVIDDAHVVAGRDLASKDGMNASVRACIDSLVLWRSLGINMIFAVQSPTLLHPEIYGNSKYYFISKTSSIDVLRDYIFNPEIFMKVEEIDYRPREQISEWCVVEPSGVDYTTYYPFNCCVAH